MASTDSFTRSPSPNSDSTLLLPLIIAFSVPTTTLVIPDDNKLGYPPASKVSIKAMESVAITDCGGGGDLCVVCLEEWRAGDVARVMPCRHRFHGDCIEKWLGVHGSCPVCRYEMPSEEEDEDEGKKNEGKGRGSGGGVWVLFFDFGGILGGRSDSGESGEDADTDFSAATDTEEE